MGVRAVTLTVTHAQQADPVSWACRYVKTYLRRTGGICAPESARGRWSPSVAIVVPGDRRPRKRAHEMCGRATVAFNAEIASAFGLG
jgi:hypothetical protein